MHTPIEISENFTFNKLGKDWKIFSGLDLEDIIGNTIFDFINDSDLHSFTVFTSMLAMNPDTEKSIRIKMKTKSNKYTEVDIQLKYSNRLFTGYITWDKPETKLFKSKVSDPKKAKLHWKPVVKN